MYASELIRSEIQLKWSQDRSMGMPAQYYGIVHGSMRAFTEIERVQHEDIWHCCDYQVENSANFSYGQPNELGAGL